MPHVKAGAINIHYEQQGSGEPLILIPYLAADSACYSFQVPEYAKHFTCFSLDLRGTGASDKPPGQYSTDLFADDVAAFMQALGIPKAHVSGLSLGAGTGLCLAAKYPQRVLSLSVHAGWTRTDPFIAAVIKSWQLLAKALNNIHETVVRGMMPWCFTPELYASRPDYIQAIEQFVRSRPAQPVECYLQHTEAVLGHDVESRLSAITAPTQITVGRHDMITSLRFAKPMAEAIRNSELVIFEGCAHAQLYEKVEEFNQKTLEFLCRRTKAQVA